MINDFSCKETEKIWEGRYSKKFPADMQNRALNKLSLLDAAKTIEDLRVPPGNRLESLKGDRTGQMSIRINNRWRICFVWDDRNAYEVHIVDYH